MSGSDCDIHGPCLRMDEFLRRTNAHYYDGCIWLGNQRLERHCNRCGADLPDVVLKAWNWKEYVAPPLDNGAVDDDYPTQPGDDD